MTLTLHTNYTNYKLPVSLCRINTIHSPSIHQVMISTWV